MIKIQNRKAHFNYEIEETYEAGLCLEGWEAKSIRAGRAQINDAHLSVSDGEMLLWAMHVTPLDTACAYIKPNPTRTRKCLMHKREIMKLLGKTERGGYTLVPLDLHFSKGRVKVTVALARGKRQYEKRADISDRDWKREQSRLMKRRVRDAG